MNAVTDRELDAFYGVEASPFEINQAITRAKRGFDADDLTEIAHANQTALLAALEDGDECEFGRIFQVARKALIAGRASIEVYGNNTTIKAGEV